MSVTRSKGEQHLLSAAKQHVARWFDRVHSDVDDKQRRTDRARLLSGLERAFTHIAKRRDWLEVIAVEFPVAGLDAVTYESRLGTATVTSERIVSTAVVPGWAYGWKEILRDEDVEQTLSWLFHYSRQYVHRSWLAGLLMALFEDHGVVLHPFADTRSVSHRYSHVITFPGKDVATKSARQALGGKAEPEIRKASNHWMRRNTLDPDVHQAIAQLLRGAALSKDGHALEALLAYDCVVQCCSSLLSRRGLIEPNPSRARVCEVLALNEHDQHSAEYGYFIRNNFGAHPRGWRWWDVEELLEEEFDALEEMARRAVVAASDIESKHTLVAEPADDWSNWLLTNFTMLFDSVWFDEYAVWEAKHPDAQPSRAP